MEIVTNSKEFSNRSDKYIENYSLALLWNQEHKFQDSLVSENLQDDMLGETKSVMGEILRTVQSEELPNHLRISCEDIQFIEEIGSGAAAEIWKCRWLHSEHAVKIFKHSDDVDSSNIVALVGFSDRGFPGRPMIVMELLNCDFCSLIRTGEYEMPAKPTKLRMKKLFKWSRRQNDFFNRDLCELAIQCWDQEPTRRPDFAEICECMCH